MGVASSIKFFQNFVHVKILILIEAQSDFTTCYMKIAKSEIVQYLFNPDS